ncbi:HAD family phosphatase [Planktotalea sp.]|uniref:HAD family hydrolase n=1 Tax=Planktotalea sp. TaxID=2029877 RepID=UPI00329A22D4
MTVNTVVFDIGGVLVDWQPHLAWIEDLGEAGAKSFLNRVNFDKINVACDGGASFSDAFDLIEDPEDRERLAQYVPRFSRAVPNKITGTWDVLYQLLDNHVPLHAITNWSAETWPEGLKAHPELGTIFGSTVVSGEVGVLKPSVEIYHLLCDRAEVRAENCVFIDDGLHNCLGAKAAGMDAIHFTSPSSLKTQLKERGLL